MYRVATDREPPPIWGEVAADPSKQEGLAFLSHYLITGMELCRHDFHGHTQLLHTGGALYNFIAGDRFVNPGQNPACPAGGFSMWTGLQGAEDIGEAIVASGANMTALDVKNARIIRSLGQRGWSCRSLSDPSPPSGS